MYIFSIRTTTVGNEVTEIAASQIALFEIAKILEGSEKVVAFTVSGGRTGSMEQKAFGYGDFKKWRLTLYGQC